MPRVRDLLDREAAGSFVGRTEELCLLHDLLVDEGPVVVHLHGIAGIGKSRLLDAFIRVARAEGATVLRLDCRGIEPTESGLLSELAVASGGAAGSAEEIAARLGRIGAKIIVALDTYEVFRLMDTWLRRAFLPVLPDNVRLILCGREAPVTAWLSDPGWHGLFRSIRLESLEQRDAAELLRRAGVGIEDAKALAGICHGHPLALTLSAAVRTERIALTGGMTQRVVEEFSRLFLTDITDPQTRRALEAASVVRRVTLPILSAILPDASPQDAQERIRALPFVQSDRDGLQIHDAVREAIASVLRADNPRQYHSYRRSAYRYFMTELPGAPASDLWRCTADLLYLLENPVVREAFFPSTAQEYAVEPARVHRESDAEPILDIIDRHENSISAGYMRRWWNEAPETFAVARDRNGSVAGFYCIFDPASVPSRICGQDPVTRAWLNHLERQPLPRQQRVLFLRRWLSAEDGEAPSPVQAACWVDVKRKYLELRPNLRRVYLTVRDLQPYAAAAVKLGFRVLAGADGCHSAMLDFGPSSVDGWLARLVAAELGVQEDRLLDCAARELVLNGHRVGLTKLEFGVMEFLQQRVGEAVPRNALLASVWEKSYDAGGNVVDVVIRGLRKKLGKKSSLIQTVHGVGYRLRREDTLTDERRVG